MRVKFGSPPAWLVWMSVAVGISPLAYAFFLDNALRSEFLSYQEYLSWLRGFYILGAPARVLSGLMNNAADFARTDIGGDGFARSILLFTGLNIVGWCAVLWILGSAAAFVHRRIKRREHKKAH